MGHNSQLASSEFLSVLPSHILNLGRAATKDKEGHHPPAMSTAAHKAAAHAAAGAKTAGKRPPSVPREIVYGISLGLLAGYLWKLHHWSNQRRTRECYSLLDQGKITVVADDPPPGADDRRTSPCYF
ncbi:putative cytochrome c oxidase subunit 5C-4 [Panicum miliaceum]|uniref:Cytochrome c oxidase subunit 5C-4 n=1 Tax=Panicum miliaceum TaxID=4540 RepID=A0A3L6ST33_PANMI|nr:putative cytochrome c oxidase subunit 5C-4 [Panicum miliaceum]